MFGGPFFFFPSFRSMARADCSRRRAHGRSPVDTALLVFSTLFHLFAAEIALKQGQLPYAGIILSSTIASCFWHFDCEPQEGLIYRLDMGLAGLWFLMDVVLVLVGAASPCSSSRLAGVVALNLLVAEGWNVANNYAARAEQPKKGKEAEGRGGFLGAYATLHSAWHLLSASKALCVARLLC